MFKSAANIYQDFEMVAFASKMCQFHMYLNCNLAPRFYVVVFWGGREGYHTILNTNVLKELSNMASFFKMAAGRYDGKISIEKY